MDGYVNGKKIVEEVDDWYRLEGEDHWHTKVYGPGPDTIMMNIGPGPQPIPPRTYGPIKIEPKLKIVGSLKDITPEKRQELSDLLKNLAG